MRLIDADALFKALGFAEPCSECDHALGCFCVDPTWNDVCGAIGDAPAIDAVPVRHGKWVDKNDGGIEGAWNYCSVCGEQAIDLYDYCPNCGAKMDEEEP